MKTAVICRPSLTCLATYQTARRHIPEDHNTLHRENPKSVLIPDSMVGIVTTPLDGQRRNCGPIGGRSKICCSSPEPVWAPTYPPILGVKQPGRKTDHPSPTSAEVKNEESYTSTST